MPGTNKADPNEGYKYHTNDDLDFFQEMENFLTRSYLKGNVARDFMLKHIHKFKDLETADVHEQEHKLEYMEVFREYQKLYEDKLLEFLDIKNVKQAEFIEMCREHNNARVSEETGGHREFIDAMVASLEYKKFMQLVGETINRIREEG